MYSQIISTDQSEREKAKTILENPEFYLKNLAEYKKMLELLSINEHLTELLDNDDDQ